ncbi:hypothetical protein MUN77_11105 [Leucobacter allii]|uniref:hypothetical protein n=1 Tax=Leucobacter allii TaxID=2932247 RepID=UPI001FD14A50|nr:hypothetical protein [Leucobacter allii]UOR00701.1 hypothetical protein MUN77_11105 [Leucobacter allii]
MPPASAAGPLRRSDPGGLRADGSRRSPLVGTGRRGRPLRMLGYALVLAVGVGIVLAPYRVAVAQTLAAIPEGRLHADLRSPEDLEAAVSALGHEIGHGNLVDVVVTDEYVIVDAPLSPGAIETDSWMYRGGLVERRGAATIQPETELEQFDARDVDWAALWPAVEATAAEAGVTALDEVTLTLGRGTDSDIESETFGRAVGPVEVGFSFSDDYHSVSYRMDARGEAVEELG